jgi:hypothetical protein
MLGNCLLVGLVAVPLSGACSQAAIREAANDLSTVQKTLLSTPLGDEMDTRIRPAVRQDIVKMKNHIAHLAEAYMACQPLTSNAETVQHDLSALASAKDSIQGNDTKYGSGLAFQVASNDRLISITAAFGIKCGSDAMLLIFEPRQNSWAEALRWQSPPYNEVSGAFWSFQHKISPPDVNGKWFVVTSRVKPWCSSTWSSIEYAILRPGPKVLLKRTEEMWWGGEDFGKLTATEGSAEIRYHSSSIDLGIHNRLYLRHYEIKGDTVKRTQPVAESPRDFVDEWLVSPWSEAQHWSAPGLEALHVRAKDHAYEFESVKMCSADAVQVALTDTKTDQVRYFRVTGQTNFTMTKIRTTPDPGCSGPNLLSDNQ